MKILLWIIIAAAVVGGGYVVVKNFSGKNQWPIATSTVQTNQPQTQNSSVASPVAIGGDCGTISDAISPGSGQTGLTPADANAASCMAQALAGCVPATLTENINGSNEKISVLGNQGSNCQVRYDISLPKASEHLICSASSQALDKEYSIIQGAPTFNAGASVAFVIEMQNVWALANISNTNGGSSNNSSKLIITDSPVTCTPQ